MKQAKLSLDELRDLLGVSMDTRIAFCKITPRIAKAILSFNNDNNRKVSNNRVSFYKKQFSNGDYFVSTSCLGFDDNGTLIDGQHRLIAISGLSDADMEFTFGVMFGVSHEMGMDTGKARSLKDNAMIFDGYDERLRDKKYAVCLEVVRSIYTMSGKETAQLTSQKEYMNFANEYADALIACTDAGLFAKTTGFSQAPTLAAFFMAYVNEVDVDTLIYIKRTLASGMFTKDTDKPISGCMIRMSGIKGGGDTLTKARFLLMCECINRVCRKSRNSHYPSDLTKIPQCYDLNID